MKCIFTIKSARQNHLLLTAALLIFGSMTLWASGQSEDNGPSGAISGDSYGETRNDNTAQNQTIKSSGGTSYDIPPVQLSRTQRQSLQLDSSSISADQKAKNCYLWARDAYGKGNYIPAAAALLEAVELLGGTNIRIQPLLVKALYGGKHYTKTKEQFKIYLTLDPDTSLAEHQELSRIASEVDRILQKELRDYRGASTRELRERYLEDYPYGRYRERIIEALVENDDQAYSVAVRTNTSAAFQNYLNSYPNGIHSVEAAQKVKTLRDDEYYASAETTNTTASYKDYLSAYPGGAHRNEALRAIDTLDKNAYDKAVALETPEAMETYIEEYPEGNYKSQAEARKTELYYKRYVEKGDSAMKRNSFFSAESFYSKALKYKPGDEYASKQLKKAKEAKETRRIFACLVGKGYQARDEGENTTGSFAGGFEVDAGIGVRKVLGGGGLALGASASVGLGWLFGESYDSAATMPMLGISAFLETSIFLLDLGYRAIYGMVLDTSDSYLAFSPRVRLIFSFGLTIGIEWRDVNFRVEGGDMFEFDYSGGYGFGFNYPTLILGYTFVF